MFGIYHQMQFSVQEGGELPFELLPDYSLNIGRTERVFIFERCAMSSKGMIDGNIG